MRSDPNRPAEGDSYCREVRSSVSWLHLSLVEDLETSSSAFEILRDGNLRSQEVQMEEREAMSLDL